MNGQLALAKFLHLAWSHWVSTDKGKKYVLPISLKIESMQHMVWLLSNYTDHSCICGHVIQSITMTSTKTSWMNKTMKELISKILHSKMILTVFQACHHHDYSSLYPMKWATIKRWILTKLLPSWWMYRGSLPGPLECIHSWSSTWRPQ